MKAAPAAAAPRPAPAWESSVMVCTLVAAIVAGVVFAIFELVALQRRLQHKRLPSHGRMADVAAGASAVGLFGGALATIALMFAYGAGGKARAVLIAGSVLAGSLLLFVIAALGCDQRKRCKATHNLGSDKLVGVVGLVTSLTVVAAATVRLKHSWR